MIKVGWPCGVGFGVAVERVDIKALLGLKCVATTPIDTPVGQERIERVVARLCMRRIIFAACSALSPSQPADQADFRAEKPAALPPCVAVPPPRYYFKDCHLIYNFILYINILRIE